MASEDFSFMLSCKPGAYIWMGVDRNETIPLHNPHYDFNDDTIELGASFWIELVRDAMGTGVTNATAAVAA
ncbi:N-acetyldiaminopimelate deacetylase [compost metagenome]